MKYYILLLLVVSQMVQATHFRGATFTDASINASNMVNATMISTWRKAGGDSSVTIRVFGIDDTTRTTTLLEQTFDNPVTDSSDPDFDVHTATITLNLSGLPAGSYVIRYEDCCRISNIANGVSDNDFAVETIVNRNDTNNNAPIVNSNPATRVAIGRAFSQNINATDLDGDFPLTYQFLTNTASPDLGAPAITGLNLDQAGQLTMSAAATSSFADGDNLVAKIRITDSSGAYSDRDVMFIAAKTDNNAPVISDPLPGGNTQTINVGQTLNITITGTDVDAGQTVLISATGVPANATFTAGAPGNPTTATFSFTPTANQAGQTFGINFDATDNDAVFPLTDSVNLQVTVNATPAQAVPTLSEWSMVLLSLLFAFIGFVFINQRRLD